MKVKFTIPDLPHGKERSRASATVGIDKKTGKPKAFIHEYTPAKTKEYEKKVALCYKQQCRGVYFPEDVPLDVRITAYFSIPKSDSKKIRAMKFDHKIRPTKKPDSSNILKSIEDGLNKVAYHDDAQIVDCQFRKFYSDNPRVVVTIQEAGCR